MYEIKKAREENYASIKSFLFEVPAIDNVDEDVLKNNRDNLVFSDTAYWDNCISYAIKDIGDRCKMLPGDKKVNMAVAQSAAGKILKETNFVD